MDVLSLIVSIIILYLIGGILSVVMSRQLNKYVNKGILNKQYKTNAKYLSAVFYLSWVLILIAIFYLTIDAIKHLKIVKFFNTVIKPACINWFEAK